MGISKVLPTMFHRRLLLLFGACVAAFGALAGQLGHLTVGEGDGLLRAAEAKLVRQRWTPTVRGQILDRKGRVLAQDQPAFVAKVKYRVIAGPGGGSVWARRAAYEAARRRNSPEWEKLDDAAREELVASYQAIYEDHLERMWDRLAGVVGVSREELDKRKEGVGAEVERRKRYFVARGLRAEYEKQLAMEWAAPAGPADGPEAAARLAEIEARAASVYENYADEKVNLARESEGLARLGPAPDNVFLDRLEGRLSRQKIEEEEIVRGGGSATGNRSAPERDGADAHVLASKLTDAQGFALLSLAEQDVQLDVSAADLPASAAGRNRISPMETVDLMPGLVVADGGDRAYPFDSVTVELDRTGFPGPLQSESPLRVTVEGVACHLLGRMRADVHEEDSTRRAGRIRADSAFAAHVLAPDREDGRAGTDRGAYQDGDMVGDSGVEGSSEDDLRGLRGLSTLHMDTGRTEVVEPERGRDVRLTIDAALQTRVQAVMSPEAGLAVVQPWQGSQGNDEGVAPMPAGTALNGAAVVIDVETGEILAMVSTPAYSHRRLREDPGSIFHDAINFPFINKAIARPYPPGSIAKALTLCGAVAHGDYTLGERIACTGHLFPNNDKIFRCWVYRDHYGFTTHSIRLGHDPDAVDALMVSCNIFYFTLGKRLGVEGVTETYARFGLGERWDLGVGAEYPGHAGHDKRNPKDADEVPEPLLLNDAIMMAIGQGPISWTPLHAADAYATLARGGVRVRPHLIDDPSRPVERIETGYDRGAIAAALEGLRRSVNEHDGTGNHLVIDERQEPVFNAPGVDVWGKTGTAQASPTVIDPDGPEGPLPKQVVRDGDHSWFVVLAGPKGGAPKYSIAVMMEYAGSGGKVSGPIINQVIHALGAEGYLPGGQARAGAGTGGDARGS